MRAVSLELPPLRKSIACAMLSEEILMSVRVVNQVVALKLIHIYSEFNFKIYKKKSPKYRGCITGKFTVVAVWV
jgi:hypothetical protein